MFTKLKGLGWAWLPSAAALLLGGICAYGAVRASFFFLTDYALWTAWPESHAYLLPLCLDALGAFGFLVYGLHPKDKFPLYVGIGAIVASMLGNAASHWFTTGKLDPSWISITLSGFVPAISIGLCVEMGVRWRKARRDADPDEPELDESANRPATDRADVRPPAAERGLVQRPGNGATKTAPRAKTRAADRKPSAGDLERAQRVRDNQWETVTIPELQGLLGCSYVPAQRARALAKNGA